MTITTINDFSIENNNKLLVDNLKKNKCKYMFCQRECIDEFCNEDCKIAFITLEKIKFKTKIKMGVKSNECPDVLSYLNEIK